MKDKIIDIFSFRTQFFQEALKQVFGSGNSSVNDQGIALDPGNFFNNTTVYIGKYLGSALYVDAMLHISMPNKKVYDIYDVKHGVIF